MADLYFQVDADYTALIQLQQKAKDLERQLRNFNPILQPKADFTKLQDELGKTNREITKMASRAALMGTQVQSSAQNVARGLKAVTAETHNASRGFQELLDRSKNTNGAFLGMSQGLGSFMKQFSAATLAVKGLQSALGLLQGSFSTIMSFQAQNATLKAILGASEAEIDGFKQSAEELGRKTMYTASQVTELQIALSKLGFTTQNIHDMEQPVLNFAQATGASLDEAASTTGAALRMFGVAEEEYEEKTIQFTNAMATATMSSALDFRMIRDNLATFGPMAHSLGMEIQDVLALFGKLKDSGVEASTAMTSLRNIFTKVSQGKVEGMGEVHSLDDFVKGLKEMGNLDVGKGMKMIGPRGGTQFITLMQQADSILALRDKIESGMNTDTTGGMAASMTNNLAGQIKMLESAWQGLVLKFQNSDGVFKEVLANLTDLINGITDKFNDMGKIDTESIKEFLSLLTYIIGAISVYKTIIASVNAYQKINDAFNREMLKRQEEGLRELIVAKQADAKVESERTIAVRENIVALQAQLNAERELMVAQLQSQASVSDKTNKKLIKAQMEVLNTKEMIAVIREEMATELEAARVADITGDKTAKKTALKNAEKLAIQEKRMAQKLESQENKVKAAEDALLLKNGQARLTQEVIMRGSIEQTSKSIKGLRSVMALLGMDMLLNPWVAGFVALAAAIYGCYKAWDYYKDGFTEAERATTATQKKMAEEQKKVKEETDKTTASHTALIQKVKTLNKETTAYKTSVEDLRKALVENGIIDQKEAEKKTVAELIDLEDKLIEKIKAEGEAKENAARIEGAWAQDNTTIGDATTKFKDNLNRWGEGGATTADFAMSNILTEDKINELAAMESYAKSLPQRTEESRKAFAELTQAQKECAQEIVKVGEAEGLTAGQLQTVQQASMNYLTTATTQRAVTYEQIEAEEERANKLEIMRIQAERTAKGQKALSDAQIKAYLAQKKGAQDYTKEVDKLLQRAKQKHIIDVRFQFSASDSAVPQWMKKEFWGGGDIGKVSTANLESALKKAKIKADGYLKAVQDAEAKHQNVIKTAGGDITVMEGLIRSNQASAAVMALETEIGKRKEKATSTATTSKSKGGGGNSADPKSFYDLQERTAKEREKTLLQLQDDTTTARINAMREGEEKILAQGEDNHRRELEQVRKQYKDALDAYVKQEKALWDADPSHKKKATKTKKGEVVEQGHDAVRFNEENFKAKSKEFAEFEVMARERMNWQLLAVDRKYFNEVTKGYESDAQARIRKMEEAYAAIGKMERERDVRQQMLNGNYSAYTQEIEEKRAMLAVTEKEMKDTKDAMDKAKKEFGEKSVQYASAKDAFIGAEAYYKQQKASFENFETNAKDTIELYKSLSDAQKEDMRQDVAYANESIEVAKRKLAELQLQELDGMYEYLKKYGVLQEQKYAIAQQYALKIAKEENEWRKKALEEEQKAEEKKVALQAFQSSPLYIAVMSENTAISADALKGVRDQMQTTLKDAASSMTPSDFKTYLDSFERINKKIVEENPFKALKDSITKAREAVEDYQKAQRKAMEVRKKYGINEDGTEGEGKMKDLRNASIQANQNIIDVSAEIRQAEQKRALLNEDLETAETDEAKETLQIAIKQADQRIAELGKKLTQAREDAKTADQAYADANTEVTTANNEEQNKFEVTQQHLENYNEAQEQSVELVNQWGDAIQNACGAVDKPIAKLIGQFAKLATTTFSSIKELKGVKKINLKTTTDSVDKVGKAMEKTGDATKDVAKGAKDATKEIAKQGKETMEDLGNTTKSVGDGIKEMGNAVTKAVAILAIIQAAWEIINAIMDMVQGSQEKKYQQQIATLDGQVAVLDRHFQHLKETMDETWGTDNINAYTKALIALQGKSEAQLKKAQAMGGASSMGSRSVAYRMSRLGFAKEYDELMRMSAEQMYNALTDPRYTDALVALNGITDAKENGADVYSALVEYADSYKDELELIEQETEKLNGISFDGLKDSFHDLVMDMTATTKDMLNEMNEAEKEAAYNHVMNSEKADALKSISDRRKQLQTDFNEGRISNAQFQRDLDALREEQLELEKRTQAEMREQYDLRGIPTNDGEATATTSSAMSITEDTANDLVGRVTAMQIAVENMRQAQLYADERKISLLEGIADGTSDSATPIIYNIGEEYRNFISTEMVGIKDTINGQTSVLADVQTILANSYLELRGINENTAELARLRNIEQNIADMSDKIKNL